MKSYLRLGARNLLRRRSRSLLTALGVLLAIGFTVGLLSISEGFMRSFDELFGRTGPELFVMAKGEAKMPYPLRGSAMIPEETLKKAARVNGVENAEPIFQTFSIHGSGGLSGMPTMVAGVPPETFLKMRPTAQIAKGRFLKKDDTLVAIMGDTIAHNLNKTVGDEIELVTGVKLKVVGVMKKSGYVFDYFVYAPLKVIQYLHETPKRIHFVMVKLENVDEIDVVTKRLKKEFPKMDVQSINELIDEAKKMMTIARAVHFGVSCFALVIGVLFVACTMIMSVSERLREFATLRAIGAPRSYVLKLVLAESITLSLIGGIGGCLFGMLLSMGIDRLLMIFVGETFLQTYVSPRIFSGGLAIALLIGAFAGILPGFLILRRNLADSLKYE
ncbi:MAG: ABC transporter permease [bacterium]